MEHSKTEVLAYLLDKLSDEDAEVFLRVTVVMFLSSEIFLCYELLCSDITVASFHFTPGYFDNLSSISNEV